MNNIKKIRKEQKLSQFEFGKLINVAQTSISQWEQNRTKPDIETAKKIVDIFNVSLEYIYGNEGLVYTNKIELTLEEQLLIELYKNATDQGRAAATETLKICKEEPLNV